MLQLILAVSVFIVAVAVYAGIGLRWCWRARRRRGILGRVAALELDPYHVAAKKYRETEAAAAELLLGGYLDIDGEGAAHLTGAGRDIGRPPARPLPAALLEAVRRHDPEPVSVGWIDRSDVEYRERCIAYRRERDALLPVIGRIPRTPVGERRLSACCGCVGVVLLVSFWILAAELLVLGRPEGLREWACAAAAAAGLTALWFVGRANRAVGARTACEDPLGDRIRAETHPALTALDERQRSYVLTSAADDGRWTGVDVSTHEDGDAYECWSDDDWADAYHYRAADHEDDEPGPAPPG
ncbi:hypothetical protein [Streptomyces sp. NPDC056491]|uniref:hypothetical protein n=1 Tax=Streptomyces sp. NPDC056491 TaxID=3345837 RepID=UPI0036A4BD0F